MIKRTLIVSLLLYGLVFGQLRPDATTIEDAYMPYGGAAMNSFALFPVIPDIGFSPDAPPTSFHLQWEVDTYSAGIAVLNAAGIRYHSFFQWAELEATDVNAVVDEDPDIEDALFGVQIRIDGTPNEFASGKYYRSMNRLEWRNFFLKSVKRAMNAGASGISIDMASTIHIDSFDPEDLAAFKTYMLNHYNGADLIAAGWNYESTDYRTWIHDELGHIEMPQTLDIPIGAPPYARDWVYFKMQRIQDTWKIIQDSINAFAQEKGEIFRVYGNNAYLGALGQAGIYTMLNLEGRNLPYYQGQLISEYFAFSRFYPLTGSVTGLMKAAQSLGVRNVLWSTPDVYPPSDDARREQLLHIVAESFASGGLAQFGGAPPIETYTPYFYLIQKQKELLNSVMPHGQAAIFMSLATGLRQNYTHALYGAQMLLQELGVSYNVVEGGNNIDWPDEFSLADLDGYDLVLLPESAYMTANQVNVLLTYVNNGGKLITFTQGAYPGYSGGLDEFGHELGNATWTGLVNTRTGFNPYGSGMVYVLEYHPDATQENMNFFWNKRNIGSSSDITACDEIRSSVENALPVLGIVPDIQRQNTDRKVQVFRHDNAAKNEMVVHFVNGCVDPASLLHIDSENDTLTLTVPENFTGDSALVTFFKPGEPDGFGSHTVAVDAGMITVVLPMLHIWTFLKTEETNGSPTLQVDNFTVSNGQNRFRLPANSTPVFSWNASVSADFGQIQIWTNANFTGTPVYDSGLFNPNSGTFSDDSWIPEEGHSYIARLMLWQNGGISSNWVNTGFHANARPLPPKMPQVYDNLNDLWYNGIYAGAVTSTHPLLRFHYGSDAENDSLYYILEVWTDSLPSNITDSTNLTLLVSEPLPVLFSAGGDGDEWVDSINATLDIDNAGMWFCWRSYDRLDTSDASVWGRFTWDHRNDPPNPFNLTSPTDGDVLNNPVNFSWEFTGDSDPASYWLDRADLYLADDEAFTDNLLILENLGEEINQNPHATYDQLVLHKAYYWKILIHDQNGGSRFSNQAGIFFTDDGSNQAPAQPQILQGESEFFSLSDSLRWTKSADADFDMVQYQLQIATDADFTSLLIDQQDIVFSEDVGTILAWPLNAWSDSVSFATHGVYFYRVRASDSFGGISEFSQFVQFTLNETPIASLPIASVILKEDSIGVVWNDLTENFADPDEDELNVWVFSWNDGIQNAVISWPAVWVTLQENYFGSTWLVLGANDPYNATVYDTLYFDITPVNDAPTLFSLLLPAENSLVTITEANLSQNLVFSWQKSDDADNESLIYALTFSSNDTVLIDTTLADTSLAVSLEWLNTAMETLAIDHFSGSWAVSVFDSTAEVPAVNNAFTLNLRSELLTGIGDLSLPEAFTVFPNYPNPFNPVTTIRLGLPDAADLSIVIYDVRGRNIANLSEGAHPAGWYEFQWNGTDLSGRQVSSGLYFCRIHSGRELHVLKMTYLR